MTISRRSTAALVTYLKLVVFSAALCPFLWLVWGIFHDGLGADPVDTITRVTGDWGLRFLLLSLAVTPLRRLTGWQQLQRLRRMLGLFGFFYVCLHFLTWALFDHSLDVATMLEDVLERPYITVGFLALVLLIPLAVTSTRSMMRRLGRNWQRLHRLAYPIAGLGVLHFWWLVKADITEPLIYALILVGLLAIRLVLWRRRRQVAARLAVG